MVNDVPDEPRQQSIFARRVMDSMWCWIQGVGVCTRDLTWPDAGGGGWLIAGDGGWLVAGNGGWW